MAIPDRSGGWNSTEREHLEVSEAFDSDTLSWCSDSLTRSDKVAKAEMWDVGVWEGKRGHAARQVLVTAIFVRWLINTHRGWRIFQYKLQSEQLRHRYTIYMSNAYIFFHCFVLNFIFFVIAQKTDICQSNLSKIESPRSWQRQTGCFSQTVFWRKVHFYEE